MKIFIKSVCSKQKFTSISKLGFHMCRQAKLMIEHLHSDPRAAPKETVCGPGCPHVSEPHPLALALKHGALGKELRLKA